MPYIGRGLTTGAQYQKLDAIAINNATTFTMQVSGANVSPDQNHLILVVNGVIQEPGTGFTVAGSTCTLASAITTSGHSGTDTIYGVIAGDAAFAAYDSIGVNALGVTAGTVTASRAVVPDSNKDIASFRNVTLTGELDAATLDISGNADIDGTTNLDAVDIDGAVQIDSTVTVGVDDTGYDVKFFGATSGAYMLWDESADDLVLAGAAGIDLEGDIDVNGTANLDVVDIDGAVDMASTLAVGGDLTTSAHLIIDADDKALVLGADQDASIWATDVGNVYIGSGQDYSLSSSDTEGWFNFKVGTSAESFLNIVAGEGGASSLYMTADQADDNADRWRLQSDTSGNFSISTFSSGSYASAISIDSSQNVGIGSSTIQTVGGGKTLSITGDAPEITLVDNASGTPYAWIATNDYGSLILAADRANEAGSSYVRMDVDGSEKMLINSSGGVTVTASSGDDTSMSFVTDRSTDGQLIHTTSFNANNSASQETTYARIRSNIIDNSDGTEDGSLTFGTMKAGTMTDQLVVESDGPVKSVGGIYFTGSSLAGADTGVASSGHGGSLRFYANGNNHMYLSDDSGSAFLNINNNDTGSAGSTLKQLSLGKSDNTALDFTNSGTIAGAIISNSSNTDDSACGVVFSHRTGSSGISYVASRNEGADRSALYFGTRGSDGVQLRMEIRNDGIMVSKKGLIFDGSSIGSGQTGVGSSGSGGDLLFYANGSAHARLQSTGRLAIGSSSANAKLDIDEDTSSQELIHLNHGQSGQQYMLLFKTSDSTRGSIVADNSPSQTIYNTSSDERLKENIVEVDDALSIVNRIPVKQFNFVEDKNDTPVIGYIGQELIQEFPNAVSVMKTNEFDDHHMVDQSKMVAVLMKAVQELSAEVEKLKGN